MAGMRHISIQSGFTLIELVVVVLILAVISGTVISAFNLGFVDDKEKTAAEFEMTQIRDAILQFKQDNPSHALADANLCSPADASFLFSEEFDNDGDCVFGENTGTPDPDQILAWDVNYRTGWQGPYLTKLGNPTATISGDIQFDGRITTGTDSNNVPVITDPYNNPYYFFELDDDAGTLGRQGVVEPRIVSTGPDGNYAGLNCDADETSSAAADYCSTENLCSAPSDDIVICLR